MPINCYINPNFKNLHSQIIANDAALLSTIGEIQDLSHRMFFNSLTSHANKLLDKVELPPSELGPVASLTQTLQLLRDVLACHDASVVPIDDKRQDYKQVIGMLIDLTCVNDYKVIPKHLVIFL